MNFGMGAMKRMCKIIATSSIKCSQYDLKDVNKKVFRIFAAFPYKVMERVDESAFLGFCTLRDNRV